MQKTSISPIDVCVTNYKSRKSREKVDPSITTLLTSLIRCRLHKNVKCLVSNFWILIIPWSAIATLYNQNTVTKVAQKIDQKWSFEKFWLIFFCILVFDSVGKILFLFWSGSHICLHFSQIKCKIIANQMISLNYIIIKLQPFGNFVWDHSLYTTNIVLFIER